MAKSESELLTSLATTLTTTTAATCTSAKTTTTSPITMQQTTRLVSLNSHTNSSCPTTASTININNPPYSINKQQRLPHNRKMKRKRKIPEISWLIVAICLNCYVIFSVTAATQQTNTNPTTTTITTTNINNTKTTPYLKQTFGNAVTNTVAAIATHNQRHRRAAAHSPDDHHIDIDDVDRSYDGPSYQSSYGFSGYG